MAAPISIRVKDDYEKDRLRALAGEMTVTDFILGAAFGTKRIRGNETDYPGWEIVERGRRDRGIRISHPKFPNPVMLYPEDKEYERYANA